MTKELFGYDYLNRMVEGTKIKRYVKNLESGSKQDADLVMDNGREPKTQEQI